MIHQCVFQFPVNFQTNPFGDRQFTNQIPSIRFKHGDATQQHIVTVLCSLQEAAIQL